MLYVVCALPCEAKALHQYFQLQRDTAIHAYQVFRSEKLTLIVSGVGKVNAASAVGYLAGLQHAHNDIWLNIGVAGHATLETGTLHVANRIIDAASQRAWYPHSALLAEYPQQTLSCVDSVVHDYPDDRLIDMESSGFTETCEKFSTLERIHCVKVISDNRQQAASNVDKDLVTQLIAQQCDTIAAIIERLQQQTSLPATNSETETLYAQLMKAQHFSQYQSVQLADLLKRVATLGLLNDSLIHELNKQPGAKQILSHLQQLIRQQHYQTVND